jgi:anti-sigma factor RsiW
MAIGATMADDLHALAAPYALDALTPEERDRFEEHLASCERCRAELAVLQDGASSRAFAVEGPAPQAELRDRISAAAEPQRENVVPLRPRRSLFASAATAFAVAATGAAVAFGIRSASLHRSLDHSRAAVRILGDPTARHIRVSGAKGELVVAPSGAAVLAVDLPSPPAGKTYEVWVAAPAARRAGQLDGGTTTLPVRVPRGARVMVTIERAGGVDAPTSQPLLVART